MPCVTRRTKYVPVGSVPVFNAMLFSPLVAVPLKSDMTSRPDASARYATTVSVLGIVNESVVPLEAGLFDNCIMWVLS